MTFMSKKLSPQNVCLPFAGPSVLAPASQHPDSRELEQLGVLGLWRGRQQASGACRGDICVAACALQGCI